MNCTSCTRHYISAFFANRPESFCLVLNGCYGTELGNQVHKHVLTKAPTFLASPGCADGCPGFEEGPPVYVEGVMS